MSDAVLAIDNSINQLLKVKESLVELNQERDLWKNLYNQEMKNSEEKSAKYKRMEKHLEKLADQVTFFKLKLLELKFVFYLNYRKRRPGVDTEGQVADKIALEARDNTIHRLTQENVL